MNSLPVLVVDDDHQVRTLIRVVLSKHGFRLLEASHHATAVRTIEDLGGNVGLIITAYSLRDLDGGTLAGHVKRHFPAVPVVLMSSEAVGSASDVAEAFLAKPFSPSMLAEIVRKLCKRTDDRGSPLRVLATSNGRRR